MGNRISIQGTLTMSVECAKCGEGYEQEVVIDHVDCDADPGYPIEVNLETDDLECELENMGWERFDSGWLCPDCADEE